MENILFVYENQLPDNFSENVEKAGITPKVATQSDELNFDKIDAVAYFGENSDNLKTVVEKAVESGVKRAVYASSAICYFNRRNPEKNLEKHPFVKNQTDCENAILAFSDKISVSVAEIPLAYPLPKEILTIGGVPALKFRNFYLTFDGGYPEIGDESAAESVLSVILNGKNGVIYPLCDKNVKFKAMLNEKYPDVKVYEFPEELWWVLALNAKSSLKKAGLTAKTDIKQLYKKDLYENYFFDDAEVKKALGYK